MALSEQVNLCSTQRLKSAVLRPTGTTWGVQVAWKHISYNCGSKDMGDGKGSPPEAVENVAPTTTMNTAE